MKKNLVLTGMMGVGKSTVGRFIGLKLKIKFVDIDRLIEKREKKKIIDIFKTNGEGYFRKIEKKITSQELKKTPRVIALGGGAIVNPIVRKEVKASSITIWLDLDLKSLMNRLKKVKKRPLLNQDDLKKSINKIYYERKKFYNEANFKIRCDKLNLHQIVNKIIKIYENSKD